MVPTTKPLRTVNKDLVQLIENYSRQLPNAETLLPRQLAEYVAQKMRDDFLIPPRTQTIERHIIAMRAGYREQENRRKARALQGPRVDPLKTRITTEFPPDSQTHIQPRTVPDRPTNLKELFTLRLNGNDRPARFQDHKIKRETFKPIPVHYDLYLALKPNSYVCPLYEVIPGDRRFRDYEAKKR